MKHYVVYVTILGIAAVLLMKLTITGVFAYLQASIQTGILG